MFFIPLVILSERRTAGKKLILCPQWKNWKDLIRGCSMFRIRPERFVRGSAMKRLLSWEIKEYNKSCECWFPILYPLHKHFQRAQPGGAQPSATAAFTVLGTQAHNGAQQQHTLPLGGLTQESSISYAEKALCWKLWNSCSFSSHFSITHQCYQPPSSCQEFCRNLLSVD